MYNHGAQAWVLRAKKTKQVHMCSAALGRHANLVCGQVHASSIPLTVPLCGLFVSRSILTLPKVRILRPSLPNADCSMEELDKAASWPQQLLSYLVV